MFNLSAGALLFDRFRAAYAGENTDWQVPFDLAVRPPPRIFKGGWWACLKLRCDPPAGPDRDAPRHPGHGGRRRRGRAGAGGGADGGGGRAAAGHAVGRVQEAARRQQQGAVGAPARDSNSRCQPGCVRMSWCNLTLSSGGTQGLSGSQDDSVRNSHSARRPDSVGAVTTGAALPYSCNPH